mgnify:FL=1
MAKRKPWLKEPLNTSFLGQNQERGLVFTKRTKINPRSAVLKNITDKADQAAKNWHKTKDPKYKQEWYKILKEIPVDIHPN